MRTVRADGTHDTEIRKSLFRCALRRVASEEDARAFVTERKKLHHDATHNCSAWVLGPHGEQQRSSDDGEPAGTAGVPMLQVLNQRDLTDVVAVVTRWFGGTKLGAGGLIRAYGGVLSAALDTLGLVELRSLTVYTVTADHATGGRLEHELRGTAHTVLRVDYGARVTADVAVAPEDESAFLAWLAETTSGRATAEAIGHRTVEVPV